MQNLGKYSFKRSRMEKRFQTILLCNLGVLVLFIIIATVINYLKTKELFDGHHYLTQGYETTPEEVSLAAAVSFYLLFSYLIPLDIAVMLELNAINYTLYIHWDAKMHHVNRTLGCVESAKLNSLNLLENLGEVEYIMSDKTGTLTQNELTFVAACCDSKSSFLFNEVRTQATASSSEEEREKIESIGEYLGVHKDFLRCLALCHDCVTLKFEQPQATVPQASASIDVVEQEIVMK